MFVKKIIHPDLLLSHLDVNAIMLYRHRKDVDNYNDHIVDKLFKNSTIYNVSIDSNAFEMVELNCWIMIQNSTKSKKLQSMFV